MIYERTPFSWKYARVHGIYCIENLATGNRYIGQSNHVRKRYNEHCLALHKNAHHNCYLQNDWNKYGETTFKFSILLVCEDFELTRYEQFLVDSKFSVYNIRKECVTTNKGITYRLETRRKKSLAVIGKSNPFYGKKHTEEAKKKMSLSHTNKLISDETRRKMSLAGKGRKHYWGNKIGEKQIGNDRGAKTHFGLITPEGVIYQNIFNLAKFCREHNLYRERISDLIHYRRDEYLGWKRFEELQKNAVFSEII